MFLSTENSFKGFGVNNIENVKTDVRVSACTTCGSVTPPVVLVIFDIQSQRCDQQGEWKYS